MEKATPASPAQCTLAPSLPRVQDAAPRSPASLAGAFVAVLLKAVALPKLFARAINSCF